MGHYDSCRGHDIRCSVCGRYLGDSNLVIDKPPYYCTECKKQKPLHDKIKRLERRIEELEK